MHDPTRFARSGLTRRTALSDVGAAVAALSLSSVHPVAAQEKKAALAS